MKRITAIYAFSHFTVDFACAFSLFAACQDRILGFLLYNFFAFAMQMPIGLVADRWNHSRYLAMLGSLLVGCVALLPSFGLAGAMVLGLGNACFHVGGGLEVLNGSAHRAAPLGVFVSPGAFGIFLGARLGHMALSRLIPLAPLVLGLLLMAAIRLLPEQAPGNAPLALPRPSVLPLAGLLFLVVVLRSYGGMSASYPWNTGILPWFCVSAVVLGKAAGGLLSDRFTPTRTALVSLLAAALCFLLGKHAVFGVLGIFLFQMTMPITLCALAEAMPGCKGFSFGLLTLALFLGFLPAFWGIWKLQAFGMAMLSLVSLCLLLPALRKAERTVV